MQLQKYDAMLHKLLLCLLYVTWQTTRNIFAICVMLAGRTNVLERWCKQIMAVSMILIVLYSKEPQRKKKDRKTNKDLSYVSKFPIAAPKLSFFCFAMFKEPFVLRTKDANTSWGILHAVMAVVHYDTPHRIKRSIVAPNAHWSPNLTTYICWTGLQSGW